MATRLTQAVAEILSRTEAPARLTQARLEVLAHTRAGARLTQAVVEVLSLSPPPPPPCEPLPAWIALGASGGPAFGVSVFTAPGGWENRLAHWVLTRGRWDVSFVHRSAADIALLLAFFRAVAQGKASAFCFRDWQDHQFNNQIGTGDGSTQTFQLVKVYHSGALAYVRPLTRPLASSLRITVNGVLTTAYTLEAAGGRLTFSAAPPSGAVIRAQGEFEVLVRFDSDALQMTCDTFGVFSCTGLTLVELIGE